jgi:predicted nucleotidyltransferase
VNLVDECTWPDLPEKYDRALREAVAYILGQFDVLGVVAAGTIVDGKPDASSDLDIYVIQNEPFRQRIQRFFGGVPAEIFVNPPAAIERYFIEEAAHMRPVTAHMLATGFVVLELDPVVGELRRRAVELLAKRPASSERITGGRYQPKRLDAARYVPATIYEDACDVAERDPATAQMLLSGALFDMLRFVFVREGRHQPRHKELLGALREIDVETWALACEFYQTALLEARLEIAGRIADRTIGVRGFFEWESDPEPVEA